MLAYLNEFYMPELPEVETVRAGLDKALAGATIEKVTLRRADLRLPFPAHLPKTLKNRQILSVKRRAKYLLWHLEGNYIILAHLGMTGRFIVRQGNSMAQKHDHLEMMLADGRQVVYHDPRRFGLITLTTQAQLAKHPLIGHLGPEPLEDAFNATYLAKMLALRKAPVKAILMDQAVVVGVGNIYASEALFLTGIHPNTPAYKAASKAKVLVPAIRKVLKDAIKSGGSSLRDFVDIDGDSGYFQHHFKVYGRVKKPCERCKTPIENITIAGRSSFFCPSCQK